ncbi:MAG: hypothetical protein IT529_11635 [Burkholderiales bacterium]|nr:hypothetical protein [Burkholderiales bacterium]
MNGNLRCDPPGAGGASPHVSVDADGIFSDLDAGGGDSKRTWRAMAGVGNSYKLGDVVFACGYLSYEQRDIKLVGDPRLGGFRLGINSRF